ncbi:LLM class flavin-dependent oxidoreductase [Catellatospora paridis]
MPSIASTSPPVLIAHLTASTRRIRIGSGGVMLPNHPALVVGEQFAMLEALHPGRIDLGVGRAPGTDQLTAAALRRPPADSIESEFSRHLLDVLGLLGDPRTTSGIWQRVHATPRATGNPAVLLLGSSEYSAQLAGKLGLPYAFAHHFDAGDVERALDLYRGSFTASPTLDRPYAIVTASALAADTDEQARRLSAPGIVMRVLARQGVFAPMPPPDTAAAHPQVEPARRSRPNLITGEPQAVADRLAELAARTGADEIMLDTETHGLAERKRSLELIATAWGMSRNADLPVAAGRA